MKLEYLVKEITANRNYWKMRYGDVQAELAEAEMANDDLNYLLNEVRKLVSPKDVLSNDTII